jgi:hypothetical protein
MSIEEPKVAAQLDANLGATGFARLRDLCCHPAIPARG